MGRRETVTAPDGQRWRVRRRWLDRPLPDLKRRWQENSKEAKEETGLEVLAGAAGVENPAAALAVVAGLALVILIVLPLLGVALELVALLLVLLVGLFGRLCSAAPGSSRRRTSTTAPAHSPSPSRDGAARATPSPS